MLCPSAGRSAECCVILALMVAPRSRALMFLNIGCGRQKIATSGHRAWESRRRAEERTSPPNVICAMCAHHTHVHSWEANWRTRWRKDGTIFIALQLLFHMRSHGFALKLVAKGDTMKPNVYRRRSFPNREEVRGRCGKGVSGEGL